MKKFNGPLFVIGMPRSGTKLLLRIFNNHPRVYLSNETEFLLYFIRKWNNIDLRDKNKFKEMYYGISKTSFFLSNEKKEKKINLNFWYNGCKTYSLNEIFKVFVNFYTNSIDRENIIWGDKSPGYIINIKLLKEYSPKAKFIVIVRDVRNCAVSSYKVWGTNKIRYAERWYNNLNSAINDLEEISKEDWKIVKYEDLVHKPRETIKKLYDFVGISFNEKVLQFTKPSENYGDAKGKLTIMSQNNKKYGKYLSKREINKIESLTFPILDKFGYKCSYGGALKRVSNLKMRYYQFLDILNRLLFDLRTKGIRSGLYIIRLKLSHFKK